MPNSLSQGVEPAAAGPGRRWTRTLLCPHSARAGLQAPTRLTQELSVLVGPVPGSSARPRALIGSSRAVPPGRQCLGQSCGPGRDGPPLTLSGTRVHPWHGHQWPLRPGVTSSTQSDQAPGGASILSESAAMHTDKHTCQQLSPGGDSGRGVLGLARPLAGPQSAEEGGSGHVEPHPRPANRLTYPQTPSCGTRLVYTFMGHFFRRNWTFSLRNKSTACHSLGQ